MSNLVQALPPGRQIWSFKMAQRLCHKERKFYKNRTRFRSKAIQNKNIFRTASKTTNSKSFFYTPFMRYLIRKTHLFVQFSY